MSIKLLGYSERGVINAICEDICNSADSHSRLVEFLSWFDFHETKPQFSDEAIKEAVLLVEQGFSDFGDLDLLVLIEFESGRKMCFMIEAKVSTYTNSWQTVTQRWDEFKDQLDGKVDKTSNLFVQLHRKVRLIAKIRAERNFTTDCLVPRGSKGNNQVVIDAFNKLAHYLPEDGAAWFGAILPDTKVDLEKFAEKHLGESAPGNAPSTWSAKRWGLLSWHVVAQKVDARRWPRTTETLLWNKGQIFRDAPRERPAFTSKSVALHDGRAVYVVDCNEQNCRIIYLDDPDCGYFWKTTKVRVSELASNEDYVITDDLPVPPKRGASYIWDSRNEFPALPTGDSVNGLQDGSAVVVSKAGWATTRVNLARENSDTFLVYTHQLRKPNEKVQ